MEKAKKFDYKGAVRNTVGSAVAEALTDAGYTVVKGADYGFGGVSFVVKGASATNDADSTSKDVEVKIAITAPSAKNGFNFDAVKPAYEAEMAAEATK